MNGPIFMPQGISLSELARRLDRAKSGLHKLAAKGQIPKLADGSFDEAAVRAALAANTDPARQPGAFSPVHGAENGERPAPSAAIVAQATAEAQLATTRVREILLAEGIILGEGEPLTFNHARTAEKIVQTWQRDQAHAKEAERLIDAEAAGRRWADEVAKLRARLLAIPGDIALELSHLSKHDLSVVDRVVRDAMAAGAGDDAP